MQKTPFLMEIFERRQISRHPRRFQDNLTITLFLLCTYLVPAFRHLSIFVSLFQFVHWNGLGPAVDFVGLENFRILC
jgi:hypothetical protein